MKVLKLKTLFLAICITFLSQSSMAQPSARWSLLIGAIITDDMRTIDNLIEAGVDVNATYNINGAEMTPLMYAVWMGRLDAVKALIKAGAYPIQHGGGWTPLMYAVWSDRLGLEFVQMLLEARVDRADVDLQNDNGTTALILAVLRGYLNIVRVLADAGADFDLLDDHSMTALLWAVLRNDLNMVRFIVSNTRADIDLQVRGGLTALMWAAWEGHLEIVKTLVLAGASLKGNDDGANALDYAVLAGHTDVANYLMEAGAGGSRGWFCRHLSIRCY